MGAGSKEAPRLSTEDTASYILGLLLLVVGEYLVLRQPHLFLHLYTGVITILICRRYLEYSRDKCQLFMLDLCYWVNLSVLAQLHLAPAHAAWFLANYSLSLGSLVAAMVVWQNSLVLHNLSKLTSLLLHAFAPLTCHLVRWGVIPTGLQLPEAGLGVDTVVAVPMLMYTGWQIGYLLITEVVLASWIRSDKEITFALRALASDSGNGMHQLVLGLMRRLGVMEAEEEFDADTVKTKLIFVSAQLVYTLATLGPVPLLYTSPALSSAYMGLVLGWCALQGAAQYLQDFVERYQLDYSGKSQ